MWPFDKRQHKLVGAGPQLTPGKVTEIETTEIITERVRSEADRAKLEVLHALLDITASEDLDAVWMTLLTELAGRGYKFQDEPKALLERLKRRF